MIQNELTWIKEAQRHIGVREIPGKQHNKTIVNWLINLKAWWQDDETPWCGVFVAHCCRVAGRDLPQHWYRAKDWLNIGARLKNPAYGCLVVFTRNGGGHVGFVVGKDRFGNLMVLGGNQSDAVNIKPFPLSRVTGYVWPALNGFPLLPSADKYRLPVMTSDGKVSTKED